MQSIKPFLKWAGGKRQLLSELKKHLPANIQNYTYYEPFVGAGALFFELLPANAVINDFNAQLIASYQTIKENVDAIIPLLQSHKIKNDETHFYAIRNLDRDVDGFKQLSSIEKAARLIYLNKTCFNGLYRVNAQGFFNVPCGKYKNPSIYDEAMLRQISNYLNANNITILNQDFEQAVESADAQSFIYFDPPYHSPDKTNFTGYQSGGFDEAEQHRLQQLMLAMTKRGTKCLLSNSDTTFIRGLYKNDMFDIISIEAKRPINANAAGRGAVKEVLVKNWR